MALPDRLRDWLKQESALWTQEGLIGEAQRERLLARYPQVEGDNRKMAFALRALGVLVFFAALLLVVSHNWESLGRGGRMGMISGLLIGLQGLAFILYLRRSEGGLTLAHLAAGLGFGAAIAMTGQVYHLDAHAPNAVLAWCLGFLPFVLLFDRTLLHLIHLALAVIWLSMKTELGAGPGENLLLIFLALLAPSALAAYRTPRVPLAAAVAVAYACFTIITNIQNHALPLSLFLLPLALASFHPAGDPRAQPWRVIGFISAASCLLVIGDLDQGLSRQGLGTFTTLWSTAPILSGVALSLILLAVFKARGSRARADSWLAASVWLLAEIWRAGSGHAAEVALVKSVANFGTLALVVVQLQLGLNQGKLRSYLAGAGLFLIWLGWRYANIHEQMGYLGMAAVFAVIGTALFVLARLWKARTQPQEMQPVVPFRPSYLEIFLARIRPYTTVMLVLTYLLQLAVIAGMVWHHGAPAREGVRVFVRCEPVDPRDWMRGDYVILGYPFTQTRGRDAVTQETRLATEYWQQQPHQPESEAARRQLPSDSLVFFPYTVSAAGLLRAGTLTTLRPEAGAYLTGRWNGNTWNRPSVRLGIEAFFVKEGTGKTLEAWQREGFLLAEIGVLPDGRAGLINVQRDTSPLTEVAFTQVTGWKPKLSYVREEVIESPQRFQELFTRLNTGDTSPLPDFSKQRLIYLNLGQKNPVFKVVENEDCVRLEIIRSQAGDAARGLLLMLPKTSKSVYGPNGRIPETE